MPKGLDLPVIQPQVFDNSILSTVQRCPRKAFYQYFAQRAPTGISYPIQYGIAVHKFYEILEKCVSTRDRASIMKLLEDRDMAAQLYQTAAIAATKGWEEPDPEHRHGYLNSRRLESTLNKAFDSWVEEKILGHMVVLYQEQSFDLELPSGRRYGGRFDQIVEWRGRLWVRDFKTVSRMGKTYANQFDPNNQMTGYVWAAKKLSGRPVEGVVIEVVYNTKTKGPEFHQFLSTRTDEHVEQWIRTAEMELKLLDILFADDEWPMRTVACNDYGGCFFREACQKDGWPNIRRWLEANTTRSMWDFTNPEAEEGVAD